MLVTQLGLLARSYQLPLFDITLYHVFSQTLRQGRVTNQTIVTKTSQNVQNG